MEQRRFDVAAALLSALALVGAVPLVLATLLQFRPGASVSLEAYVAFLKEPHVAIVYAILFAVGCLLAVRSGKFIWAVSLLPLLTVAIWPLFRAADEGLPVPVSAIVAFAGDCPRGWQATNDLAGRFMLGAGKGEKLTARSVGESDGEEDVTLKTDHMPNHNHNNRGFNRLLAHNGRTVGVEADSDGASEPDVYNSAVIEPRGGGLAHNNMPPYFVVQFCVRNGPTAVSADNTMDGDAATGAVAE